MVTGIIGRKLGMTQVFAKDGTVSPATVIKAGPCGRPGEGRGDRRLRGCATRAGGRKAGAGPQAARYYHKKAGVPPTRVRREESSQGPSPEGRRPGICHRCLHQGDRVDVIGISRGKGFQGVMKRHNFRGGAATHGSMFHRAPGSIGASSFPSRVVKGMRAAGRMGGDRVGAEPEGRAGGCREQSPRDSRSGPARRAATSWCAKRSPRSALPPRSPKNRARLWSRGRNSHQYQ